MREHRYDVERDSLRPKADRIDEPLDARLAQAAVSGRRDALHPSAVMDLQRVAGNAGVVSALEDEERSPVHDVVSSNGRGLDTDVRSDMETRLGADFGDVRVHDDAAAHESATSVGAHAYTVGSNVVFQRDAYDPSSEHGRTTLAHELTHVMQQRSGPVDGTSAPGGIRVSDPSDRYEREAADNANRVMAQPSPTPALAPAVQRETAADATVQPEEPEEEEPVQGLFVQREEAEEEVEE
ncbi:DUF4157 domain-containing protein [Angustibacter sp. McL0619]|uniref:eCIS core domain-containing protein n=1 Tax=Angustibacter sp. McL0619 TaxID=3415676 RepID=UPI003CF835CD